MELRLCDRFEGGLGWIVGAGIPRAAHALAVDGGVWLVDPVDAPGLDEEVRALGEPRGVVQLLDRHGRDCAVLATRYGVPHLRVPFAGIPGAPFEVLRVVDVPRWREAALWWPERRVLVVADALGTLPYFLVSGETLGVHPLLRLTPPRVLAPLEPEHVLCGHGEGLHGPAVAAALRDTLGGSRRRAPAAYLSALRAVLKSARGRAD